MNNRLGEIIYEARVRAGLTLAQVAEKSGFVHTAWHNWENGIRKPKLVSLPTIAQTLGLDLDELTAALREMKSEKAETLIAARSAQNLNRGAHLNVLQAYANRRRSELNPIELALYENALRQLAGALLPHAVAAECVAAFDAELAVLRERAENARRARQKTSIAASAVAS